ncbi:hypothetical protein NA57DRAFT_51567 [Rhizodiscina lignyota]|uniref:Uncharacterized protein n=1 Tax=Rhizodiscina lignyota TaxID=1504668 RepID=A0A9P4IRK3_9PEZI|nr:hypothetical protein NA57DRAFT_51567 [Rhizodiscina lignyota]
MDVLQSALAKAVELEEEDGHFRGLQNRLRAVFHASLESSDFQKALRDLFGTGLTTNGRGTGTPVQLRTSNMRDKDDRQTSITNTATESDQEDIISRASPEQNFAVENIQRAGSLALSVTNDSLQNGDDGTSVRFQSTEGSPQQLSDAATQDCSGDVLLHLKHAMDVRNTLITAADIRTLDSIPDRRDILRSRSRIIDQVQHLVGQHPSALVPHLEHVGKISSSDARSTPEGIYRQIIEEFGATRLEIALPSLVKVKENGKLELLASSMAEWMVWDRVEELMWSLLPSNPSTLSRATPATPATPALSVHSGDAARTSHIQYFKRSNLDINAEGDDDDKREPEARRIKLDIDSRKPGKFSLTYLYDLLIIYFRAIVFRPNYKRVGLPRSDVASFRSRSLHGRRDGCYPRDSVPRQSAQTFQELHRQTG